MLRYESPAPRVRLRFSAGRSFCSSPPRSLQRRLQGEENGGGVPHPHLPGLAIPRQLESIILALLLILIIQRLHRLLDERRSLYASPSSASRSPPTDPRDFETYLDIQIQRRGQRPQRLSLLPHPFPALAQQKPHIRLLRACRLSTSNSSKASAKCRMCISTLARLNRASADDGASSSAFV